MSTLTSQATFNTKTRSGWENFDTWQATPPAHVQSPTPTEKKPSSASAGPLQRMDY